MSLPSTASFGPGTRDANLERLASTTFDVCVIGGGISGVGVALDAASRGLSVALVEAGDLAGGTSSRSSGLIHGGLRYLASGQVGLCREALREREVLRRLAPHLIRPMRFVYPVPRGRRGGTVRLGLTVYDVLAGRRRPGRHREVTASERTSLAESLRWDRMSRAWTFWDASTSDARLVLEVALAAHAHGATVANHVRAIGMGSRRHRVAVLYARDMVGGVDIRVQARVFVNATGVWAEDVARLDGGGVPRLRPSKGIHLVVSREALPISAALAFHASDGRPVFALPDDELVVVGTTDTEHRRPLEDVAVEETDLQYLIEALGGTFDVHLGPGDIVATWAGLRPLIDRLGRSTASLSRRHQVSMSKTGLVTVTGGKLTTYRRAAAESVDVVAGMLGGGGRSVTASLPLGCRRSAEGLVASLVRRGDRCHMSPLALAGLVARHGDRARDVLRLIEEVPSLAEPIDGGNGPVCAEAVWAVRHELAVHLDDVTDRRLRIATRSRDGGLDGPVPGLVGRELGWDPSVLRSEIERARRSIEAERGSALLAGP